MGIKVIDWFRHWWYFSRRKLKPCVLYSPEIRLTTILLEDRPFVASPWGFKGEGHAVDCLYAFDGRLIGIQIWDDVRERPEICQDAISS